MNKHVKNFLHRGLLFGGFGPIVAGIVYLILSYTLDDFSLSGKEVFLAILSTYLLAFVHAGTSVFHQIERLPVAKAALFQLGALYLSYTVCYLVNAWIPFDWKIIATYTAIFVGVYLIIWVSVLVSVRMTKKQLNAKLRG